MAEDNKDELESENQADEGENVEKQSAGKDSTDYKQIAEDQKRRAEKAEAELKALKKPKEADKPVVEPDQIKAQTSDPLEVAKLANALSGLSEEAIAQLSVVAKAKGISLAEAKKDPLFTAWYNQEAEVAKRDAAKRGASRGSSQGEEEKAVEGLVPDIHKPLSEQREAHMAAVKKMMGK